jgi:hypothetical protein
VTSGASRPYRSLFVSSDCFWARLGEYTRRPKRDARFPPQYIWTFAVSSSDGDILTVTGHSSQKSGDNAKATRWVEAILDRPLEPDEGVDFDDLVGCWCKVTLTIKEGRSKVEDVSPRNWEE